jgi:hypothetical protein
MSLTNSEERQKNRYMTVETQHCNTRCLQIPHLEDLGVDWRIILKYILHKSDGRALTGIIRLRTGDKSQTSVNEVMDIRVP